MIGTMDRRRACMLRDRARSIGLRAQAFWVSRGVWTLGVHWPDSPRREPMERFADEDAFFARLAAKRAAGVVDEGAWEAFDGLEVRTVSYNERVPPTKPAAGAMATIHWQAREPEVMRVERVTEMGRSITLRDPDNAFNWQRAVWRNTLGCYCLSSGAEVGIDGWDDSGLAAQAIPQEQMDALPALATPAEHLTFCLAITPQTRDLVLEACRRWREGRARPHDEQVLMHVEHMMRAAPGVAREHRPRGGELPWAG